MKLMNGQLDPWLLLPWGKLRFPLKRLAMKLTKLLGRVCPTFLGDWVDGFCPLYVGCLVFGFRVPPTCTPSHPWAAILFLQDAVDTVLETLRTGYVVLMSQRVTLLCNNCRGTLYPGFCGKNPSLLLLQRIFWASRPRPVWCAQVLFEMV